MERGAVTVTLEPHGLVPMKYPLPSLLLACSVAAAIGCYTGSATDTNRLPDGPATDVDPTDPPGHDAGSKRDGGAKNAVADAQGLPCDVAAVVLNACGDCHGPTPAGGAQNRLVRYEDFAAPSPDDPSQTMAALALSRMKSSSRPMPPAGNLDAATIAVFAKWVAAGIPKGASCDAPAPDGDGGGPPPDPPDAGPPPVSVCTSGIPTHPTDAQDELMNPGMACVACHKLNPDQYPDFKLGGTVYPTAHEPDSCAGAAAARVLVIDAVGNVHTADTNAHGNFIFDSATPIPPPYRAMVINGTNIRQMKTPQTDGDCNGCHTEWGSSGAPGRVRMP